MTLSPAELDSLPAPAEEEQDPARAGGGGGNGGGPTAGEAPVVWDRAALLGAAWDSARRAAALCAEEG